MSADHAAQAAGTFDPAAIRRRLPSDTSDRQERALICAVRNPDASPYEIAQATGLHNGEVTRALTNLERGHFGQDPDSTRQARDRRATNRRARAYSELTDKQRAVVDYRALHDPGFNLPGAAVARGINASTRYDVSVDETFPARMENDSYADRIDKLVAERGFELIATGELGDAETDESDRAQAAHRLETREYLEHAGLDLPAENLDSLDRVGDGLPDDIRLDMAHENGNGSSETLRDAETPDAVPESAVENYLGDNSFGDDEVRPGTAYRGVVNGISSWCVWVTIGGDRSDPDDVSGPVPVEALQAQDPDDDPANYDVGDMLAVVATGRSKVDDRKVRHRFAPVDVLPDDVGECADGDESGPAQAGAGDDDDGTESAQAATESDESGVPEPTQVTLDGDVPDESGVASERVAEAEDRLEALQAKVERLGEQVDENAEALPTGEQARALNEAAERVLDAESEIRTLIERVDALESDVQGDGGQDADAGDDYGPAGEFALSMLCDYLGRDSWIIRDVDHEGEGRTSRTATLTITFEDVN